MALPATSYTASASPAATVQQPPSVPVPAPNPAPLPGYTQAYATYVASSVTAAAGAHPSFPTYYQAPLPQSYQPSTLQNPQVGSQSQDVLSQPSSSYAQFVSAQSGTGPLQAPPTSVVGSAAASLYLSMAANQPMLVGMLPPVASGPPPLQPSCEMLTMQTPGGSGPPTTTTIMGATPFPPSTHLAGLTVPLPPLATHQQPHAVSTDENAGQESLSLAAESVSGVPPSSSSVQGTSNVSAPCYPSVGLLPSGIPSGLVNPSIVALGSPVVQVPSSSLATELSHGSACPFQPPPQHLSHQSALLSNTESSPFSSSTMATLSAALTPPQPPCPSAATDAAIADLPLDNTSIADHEFILDGLSAAAPPPLSEQVLLD